MSIARTLAAVAALAGSLHAVSAPTGRSSENTPIDYPGGSPPADVVGAFDDDDNRYLRAAVGIPCETASDQGVPYDTVTLTNTGANTAMITVRLGRMPDPRAACPDKENTLNPFLSVYEGSFDPHQPLANCIAAVDDTDDANDRCPTLANLPVPPGETVVFVLAVRDAWAESDYALVFDSTLPVELLRFQVD